VGAVSFPGAGVINTSGAVTVSATLTATTMRASNGALGSLDQFRVPILGDFHSQIVNSNYVYQQLPSGVVIQAYQGSSITGNADYIPFQNRFPTSCIQVIASEGDPSGGWPGGQVTVFGTQFYTPDPAAGFYIYTYAWNGSSWGPRAPVSYRYIALGY
jgi:hypothetical protein